MNRILSLLLVLLIAASSANRVSASDTVTHNQNYSDQKGKSAARSEQEKNLEGTVEVAFKIDGAGKVEIININATSPQLADYVIKKLNKIQLERGDPQIGQIIKYRFVFKKQV